MENIILIAAPGAGKGTVSKLLKEKYNYVHISTGDMLREGAAKEDELGNKIKAILEQGLFVNDEQMFEILTNRLSEDDVKNGFILDGFPRNIEQADKYEEISKNLNLSPAKVIVLDVPKEILLERITGRRLCSDCGAIYNIFNPDMTPKTENICDLCGGKLYQRSDDNEESFKTRFETYLVKTEPLINYYKEKAMLHVIDAAKGSNYALEQIEGILGL